MKATLEQVLSWLASQRYAIEHGCSQREYRRGWNDAIRYVERHLEQHAERKS